MYDNKETKTYPELKLMIDEIRQEHDSKSDKTNSIIALLRDSFLDIKTVNEYLGYDILGEVVSDPHLVLYYTALYIRLLEGKVK